LTITSQDIAKMAGVSRTAVSAVLNGHYNKVSLEKREKILAIAHDLNYRPNPAALGLARRNTRVIGLVVSPFMSAIYSDLVSKISFSLREQQFSCSLMLPADAKQEQEAIRHFESIGVDGIIIVYAINDVRQYYGRIPVVSMSPYAGQYEVRVDLKKSMAIAVNHLREHGYQRVGMICPQVSVVSQQWDGYLASVGKNNAFRLEATSNPRFNAEFAHLLQDEQIKGWIVTNDFLAGRIMRYLQSHAYRIPEDAALVGFDGAAWTELVSPTLTTIVFPAARIAEACTSLLMRKIDAGILDFTEDPELIEPQLRLGESCGCTVAPPSTVSWVGQSLTFDNADGQNICSV